MGYGQPQMILQAHVTELHSLDKVLNYGFHDTAGFFWTHLFSYIMMTSVSMSATRIAMPWRAAHYEVAKARRNSIENP